MTITLEDRIAAINATSYPDDWKARQIEGAKLTFQRLAERGPSDSYPVAGPSGYWPAQPVGDKDARDPMDEARARE